MEGSSSVPVTWYFKLWHKHAHGSTLKRESMLFLSTCSGINTPFPEPCISQSKIFLLGGGGMPTSWGGPPTSDVGPFRQKSMRN